MPSPVLPLPVMPDDHRVGHEVARVVEQRLVARLAGLQIDRASEVEARRASRSPSSAPPVSPSHLVRPGARVELSRPRRQHLATVRPHHDQILDANAEAVRRRDRRDRVRGSRRRRSARTPTAPAPRAEAGVFVELESDSVPQAVDVTGRQVGVVEQGAMPASRKAFTDRALQVPADNTGAGRGGGASQGGEDVGVRRSQRLRRLSPAERSGGVGEEGAAGKEIHDQRFSRPDRRTRVAGVVRHAAVSSRSDDVALGLLETVAREALGDSSAQHAQRSAVRRPSPARRRARSRRRGSRPRRRRPRRRLGSPGRSRPARSSSFRRRTARTNEWPAATKRPSARSERVISSTAPAGGCPAKATGPRQSAAARPASTQRAQKPGVSRPRRSASAGSPRASGVASGSPVAAASSRSIGVAYARVAPCPVTSSQLLPMWCEPTKGARSGSEEELATTSNAPAPCDARAFRMSARRSIGTGSPVKRCCAG